jgi:hypothetical protein
VRRTHLLDRRVRLGGAILRNGVKAPISYRLRTMCDRYEPTSCKAVTKDPGLVSCLLCIRVVERREEGVTDEAVRSRARPRARQRAFTMLAERHPDEFADLLDQAITDLMPEVRASEESWQRDQEAHPL